MNHEENARKLLKDYSACMKDMPPATLKANLLRDVERMGYVLDPYGLSVEHDEGAHYFDLWDFLRAWEKLPTPTDEIAEAWAIVYAHVDGIFDLIEEE
jgi:hypothetical protein